MVMSALTNLLRDENGYRWTHNLETRFGCNDPNVNERIDNVCKEKKMMYISFMDSSTDEKVFIHPKRQTTGKKDGMSKEEKFALRLLGQKSKKTDNNEVNNNSTNKRKQGDDDDLHDALNNDKKKRKTGGSGDDSDSDSP